MTPGIVTKAATNPLSAQIITVLQLTSADSRAPRIKTQSIASTVVLALARAAQLHVPPLPLSEVITKGGN